MPNRAQLAIVLIFAASALIILRQLVNRFFAKMDDIEFDKRRKKLKGKE